MSRNHSTIIEVPEMVEPLVSDFVLLTAEQFAMLPREEKRAYLVRRNGVSGFIPVKAIASSPQLAVGIYPCRMIAFVTHIEDNGVLRPFTSRDGMRLNDSRNGVVLEPNKPSDHERLFCEPAIQIGIMFQIIGGKYADDNKFIPFRLNLSGFKKGSKTDSATLSASGQVLVQDWACVPDATNPNLFHRIPDKDVEADAYRISGKYLGALLGLEKDETATSDDIEIAVGEGEELTCNVKIVEEEYLGKKVTVPKHLNKFDLAKADPKAVEEKTEEPFQTESKKDIFD